MSEQHCVVDLSLPEPGLFISGGEDLDRYALTMPQAPPHLAIAALSLSSNQRGEGVTYRHTAPWAQSPSEEAPLALPPWLRLQNL